MKKAKIAELSVYHPQRVVTNREIEEIWSAVPVGTPIHIKP